MEKFKKKIWHLLPAKLKPRFIFLISLSLVGTILEMVGISMLIPIMSSLTGQLDLIQDFLNKFNIDINISILTIENLLLFFFSVIFLKNINLNFYNLLSK